MRTGLPKQKKTTDIWFDEKDPLIHIRTHNTDLKKRLAAYAEQHPDVCRQTDADPETGCMEFCICRPYKFHKIDFPVLSIYRSQIRVRYCYKTCYCGLHFCVDSLRLPGV